MNVSTILSAAISGIENSPNLTALRVVYSAMTDALLELAPDAFLSQNAFDAMDTARAAYRTRRDAILSGAV